jgi:magnesium-transporting ATPase (P-type)
VALVLSLVLRDWTDAAVIGALLVMNGLVAFTEEHQAANAMAALKQLLAWVARVLRDGAWQSVPARELMPGDVIRVRLGDVAPADARLLGEPSLQVDQSPLTGESLLARRQAVVSHLPAVEELGGIDVLCSDKTGTLTQNRLAVASPWTAPGVSAAELLAAAALASRAEDHDPIDLAVLAAAPAQPGTPEQQVADFVPFDPVTKRTEATVSGDGAGFTVSKGAPQVIAQLCAGDSAVAQMNTVAEDFAARGYRSLGVARAEAGRPWRLLGVLPLADPPRDDSAATISAACDLGVSVKMVTGDQVAIGREIARQVGLGRHILDASALSPVGGAEAIESKQEAADAALAARVEAADGFAQVFPEHKYRIVRLLQARGQIVGMTGDGVNDAPALKQADAGIAVAGATDAARAAADVVLLAPGLSVIVDAIRQAREIFARMTSYATYRIAETLRVLLLIVLAIVAFNFFPLTAVMIVFLGRAQRRRDLDHRLRPRPRFGAVRGLGHAHRPGDHHRTGHHGGGRDLPAVRPGRSRVRAQPRPHPHADLPETVSIGAPDHLRRPHPRPILDPARAPARVLLGAVVGTSSSPPASPFTPR